VGANRRGGGRATQSFGGNILREENEMMKYIVTVITLLAGTSLALSPMLFAGANVHPDRIFHAQWAGFILLACGVALGFSAIACDRAKKTA
jgi:hypothetical protein